jgi:hypothetical protein
MREFCAPSVPIYMYDKDNNYTVKKLGEVCISALIPAQLVLHVPLPMLRGLTQIANNQLIPLAFGPDDLPPPES